MSVAFIRSNDRLAYTNGTEIGGNILYGFINADAAHMLNRSFAQHVGDDFHVFSLSWTETHIRWSVDDNVYGELLATATPGEAVSRVEIADQLISISNPCSQYYLSLGVGVGGVLHFPEQSLNGRAQTHKPWKNDDPKAELNFWRDADNWLRTWSVSDSALVVDYVRVYAL